MSEADLRARAARLRAFLDETGSQPVIWGRSDCSAAPVAWLKAESGRDVALPDYCDRDGALKVIASFGTLADAWAAIAARQGIFERHSEPELGDIGVIDTHHWGQIGGIIADGRIIFLRHADGPWRPIGPVRRFVKVFALP